MKRVRAKIDKMKKAVAEYLEAREYRDMCESKVEHHTKKFVKPNGEVIQLDDSIGMDEYIESCERVDKAEKSVKAAIKSAAETLGYGLKSDLRYADEIVFASETISFQFDRVMRVLNGGASHYNSILTKNEFLTNYTEEL